MNLRAGTVPSSRIEVRPPATAAEWDRYYDLRWRVLREPWSQQRGQERDEFEDGAIHLALWLENRMVAVGRVHFPEPGVAQVRYMAVEPELQGRELGGRLLQALELRAQEAGAQILVLNARDRAVRFYRRHGFAVVEQAERLFDVIPHWIMEKPCPPRVESPPLNR